MRLRAKTIVRSVGIYGELPLQIFATCGTHADELSAPKTDDARILPSGEYSWQTGIAEPEGGCAGSEGRIRKLGST